ncbi:hypothetical protein GcM1_115006 [Golovinomyces cichoracearum]|uniref:Uncharacterized protein n=1 Tax=Golovinomyces cichoracearum TaxID=62708 RepID=A0A420JC63_9PEZI|nr:hypothetical protein GcM1_115006 [Golovinomyces cichoracearum]
MVEKALGLAQRIRKKITDGKQDSAVRVSTAVLEVNRREIPLLLFSPVQILFGFSPASTLEDNFPMERRKVLAAAPTTGSIIVYLEEDEDSEKVVNYAKKNKEIVDRVGTI